MYNKLKFLDPKECFDKGYNAMPMLTLFPIAYNKKWHQMYKIFNLKKNLPQNGLIAK